MYEDFYGFSEKPFNLTPDPKFLYLSGQHHEAFAHLEFGLRQRGGFIVITGEVGTGKTTLCRYFLDRLDEDTVSAFILYPALGTTELLRAINRDLGIAYDGATDKELIDALHHFLLASRQAGKNIVLVIDEAQNLSRNVLEQVRLISNLETHTEKLIQIVLLGQSELNDMLAQKDLRQLAQRVTARYHLTPLGRREMDRYIGHRLAVVGGVVRVEFTDGALRAIHRYSKGIPRLINLICDRALLAGYVLETTRIGAGTVRRVAKELSIATEARWLRRVGWGAALSAAAAILLGAALGYVRGAEGTWIPRPPELLQRLRASALFGVAPSVLRAEPEPERDADVEGRDEDVARRFALRLVTLSRELSRAAAAAVVLDRWGTAPGDDLFSATDDIPDLAARASLEYNELDTTLAQLRALNLPAVLEVLHPDRDTELYVALTSLDDEAAVVQFAPGDELRVPLDVLRQFWNGRARLFWRDFDRLRGADARRRLAWTRSRLAALGLLSAEAEASAAGVESVVRELQERLDLVPDGVVGQQTQMALYSLAGSYSTPKLRHP